MGIIKGITSIKHDLSGVNTSDSTSALSAGKGKDLDNKVSSLLDTPYCNAYNSLIIETTSDPEDLILDTTDYNYNSMYSPSSGWTTIPSDGIYRIEIVSNISAAGAVAIVEAISGTIASVARSSGGVYYVVSEVPLSVGDIIKFRFSGSIGSSVYAGQTRLMIRRLF